MADNNEGTSKIKSEVVHKFLKESGRGAGWLARRAGVHQKSLERWLRGKPAYYRNIAELANAMGMGMQAISAEELPEYALAIGTARASSQKFEDWEVKLPHEAMKTWTPAKRAAFLEGLRLIIAVGGKVPIVNESEGCLKVTLRLTPEQATALVRAHAEGKLASLGISELRPAATPLPLWRRINYRRVAAGLSIACSFSGVIPIWAPPAYVTGLLLASISLVMAYRARAGYILSACGLVMNAMALVMWPMAIGFFRTDDGFEFNFKGRAINSQPDTQQIRGQLLVNNCHFQSGDKIDILIDGIPSYTFIAMFQRGEHGDEGYIDPLGFGWPKTTPGSHQFDVMFNSVNIYSGEVQLPRAEHLESGHAFDVIVTELPNKKHSVEIKLRPRL